MRCSASIIKDVELRPIERHGTAVLRAYDPLTKVFLFFKNFFLTFDPPRQITWSHLWFLAYLSCINSGLSVLPLLVRLARCAPRAVEPAALTVISPRFPMALLLVRNQRSFTGRPAEPSSRLAELFLLILRAGVCDPGLDHGLAPAFEHVDKERHVLFLFIAACFWGMPYNGESAAGAPVRCADRVGRHRTGLGFASLLNQRDARPVRI